MRKSPELYDKVINGIYPPPVREQALYELCNIKSKKALRFLGMLANGGVLPPNLSQRVLDYLTQRRA